MNGATCASHIASVVPSEFDSMSTGARSGPSTSTWIGQPSALITGMVSPFATLAGQSAPVAARLRRKRASSWLIGRSVNPFSRLRAARALPALAESAFPSARPRSIPERERRRTPMAMTMNGQVQLAASREVVWAKLNDPEVLKSCIPGSEQLDKISDNEFQAIATVKVGPVKARWKGKVRLSDLDPPNSYRISGEGEGGVAGFAKGGAKVSVSGKDGGTLLSYDVEAQIGGKLAQLGQRLINSAAKKTADDFFVKFAAAVTQSG